MKMEVKLSRYTKETYRMGSRKEKIAIKGTWSKCIAYLYENGLGDPLDVQCIYANKKEENSPPY